MKLPRFRLTVRRMMILVAVVAILLGLGVYADGLRRQSNAYQLKAYEFAEIELFSHASHVAVPATASEEDLRAARQQTLRTREWARDLRLKYTRAARYPWITLEPDPPAPK